MGKGLNVLQQLDLSSLNSEITFLLEQITKWLSDLRHIQRSCSRSIRAKVIHQFLMRHIIRYRPHLTQDVWRTSRLRVKVPLSQLMKCLLTAGISGEGEVDAIL